MPLIFSQDSISGIFLADGFGFASVCFLRPLTLELAQHASLHITMAIVQLSYDICCEIRALPYLPLSIPRPVNVDLFKNEKVKILRNYALIRKSCWDRELVDECQESLVAEKILSKSIGFSASCRVLFISLNQDSDALWDIFDNEGHAVQTGRFNYTHVDHYGLVCYKSYLNEAYMVLVTRIFNTS